MNHTMPKHIKAGTVNARRREADKRLVAEFAQRRIELAAKLDAIFAAKKAKADEAQALWDSGTALGWPPMPSLSDFTAPDGALQRTIDYGAELQELEDGMADDEFNRRGC